MIIMMMMIFTVSSNCTWWSCMEWCLSATQPPDQCVHLYANVRNNGTNIRSDIVCQSGILRKSSFSNYLHFPSNNSTFNLTRNKKFGPSHGIWAPQLSATKIIYFVQLFIAELIYLVSIAL